jgi:hypothetical protein
MHGPHPFTTTISMPLSLRARIDVLRAHRADLTGTRPTAREVVVEALELLVASERRVRRAKRPRREAAR